MLLSKEDQRAETEISLPAPSLGASQEQVGLGAWTEPKTGSSCKGNPKSGAGKASHQPSPECCPPTGANLAKGTGQVLGWSGTSWNLPFLSPQLGFPSPLLSPHRPLSKPRGAGGLFQGAGRVTPAQGSWWDPGGCWTGQRGRSCSRRRGWPRQHSLLMATACRQPQEKTEPSFIYFSCRLCFRCSPEGPFEAAQAAPDPSPQPINMCRQPGLPGAAEQGQP